MFRILFFSMFFLYGVVCNAQLNSSLTVEKIMSDTIYLGDSPSDIQWSDDSKAIFFNWRPVGQKDNIGYSIAIGENSPNREHTNGKQEYDRKNVSFSKDLKKMVFERSGDIFIKDLKIGAESILIATSAFEKAPYFSHDDTSVIFQSDDNLYRIGVSGQGLQQLTNFTRSNTAQNEIINEQDAWLREDQLTLFDILKKQQRESKISEPKNTLPKTIFLPNSSTIANLSIDKQMRFVVFSIANIPEKNRTIEVPNYVTLSGYTESISGRAKVGGTSPTYTTKIYDIKRDTIYNVKTHNIPQIKRLPEYLNEYPDQLEQLRKENKDRNVNIGRPIWSPDGSNAVVNIVSLDNKDRWIMRLDPINGELLPLDHQYDEAWIGGPGIGSFYGNLSLGWLNDETIYFQSEVTGYSHIYTLDIENKKKKQLTTGLFEVQTLQLSKDKKSFYLTANIEHPGITHFYKLSVEGGDLIKLTSMKGLNEVTLSPDEKWLAIRYSNTTKPWELYVQENKPKALAKQITHTTSPSFAEYDWKVPETITFKNRHGVDTYAQVFKPSKPLENNPAVVFVHSNGYLQNVHYGWSYHFREYMFNNLLVDEGFTVLNIEYNASSGYGRDYRTGIYRDMGGRDLSDVTDSAKLLVEKYDINPNYIGLYGGSYGGFLTLMALFKEPDVFKSGAALRSVTDWAHYNQRYTSNILNTPLTDEKAYKRSSPIYFAEGLKGHLLMTHGIVDVNVNFQDIIRLSQRLIELGKDNWDLAVYPIEDHTFTEASSWTDQYKRILNLFKSTLTK